MVLTVVATLSSVGIANAAAATDSAKSCPKTYSVSWGGTYELHTSEAAEITEVNTTCRAAAVPIKAFLHKIKGGKKAPSTAGGYQVWVRRRSDGSRIMLIRSNVVIRFTWRGVIFIASEG
jgi:hypothetical protein